MKAPCIPSRWRAKSSGAWGLRSVIVVSDGYHIFRVKKMLESHGLTVYGSPRKDHHPEMLRERVELRETGDRVFVVESWRSGVTLAIPIGPSRTPQSSRPETSPPQPMSGRLITT